MSRWTIEKSGTGIEKSGTGIEKSGTGIEKSGTGIEKSGTGIEKSGTGIRRGLLACTLAALACAGNVQAGNIDPAGSLQIVVNNDRVAVSWIIGDSVFSGVSTLSGSYANLMLTEVALSIPHSSVDVTGNGTGSNTQVTGNGTGSNTQVTGNGTGSTILVTGNGTGAEAITITLPNGTGMEMEVIVGCDTAAVSVMDDLSMTVVAFTNVPVIGNSGFCGNSSAGGFGADFRVNPGRDFQSSD
jgi:hypothetical protein